jgi:hypothetical protein
VWCPSQPECTSGSVPSRHLAAMPPFSRFGPKQTLSQAHRTGFISTRPGMLFIPVLLWFGNPHDRQAAAIVRTSETTTPDRVGPDGEIIAGCLLLLLALHLAEDSGGCEDLWQYNGWLLVTIRRRARVEQIERHSGSAVHLEDLCNFGILSGPIGL